MYPARLLVLIPCRNCREFISECLESLLAQTFPHWQALVADDASDDGTGDVVSAYCCDPRIRYRRLSPRGWLMGNTLEALRSLDPAPSDVVAILDGDDFIYPTCLERIWEAHCNGFDIVYTNMDIQGQTHSIGRQLLEGIPARHQSWCFSHLRSFKGYLFSLLDDGDFRDTPGNYFRAAGDLSLYLPMAELAGPGKIRFIDERLHFYRVHDRCNFKIKRREQLDNNRLIRSRPVLAPQTEFFDFTVDIDSLDKAEIFDFAARTRLLCPEPCTVLVRLHIGEAEIDSWQAYTDMWVGRGVYLRTVARKAGATDSHTGR